MSEQLEALRQRVKAKYGQVIRMDVDVFIDAVGAAFNEETEAIQRALTAATAQAALGAGEQGE